MGKMKTLWQWVNEEAEDDGDESFEITLTCDTCGDRLQPLKVSTGTRFICLMCSKG